MTISALPVVPEGKLLGHSHLFKGDRLAFLRMAAEIGPVSRARFLHRWAVLANSPQAVHEVLVDQARSFEKASGLRIMLREIAGDGLFTSEGDLWRRQRRLMSPLFHGSQLAGHAATMNEVARRARDRLRDGETIDLAREMTRVTMGVVASTLFGVTTLEQADELGAALTTVLKWVDDGLASAALGLQVSAIEALYKLRPHIPPALTEVETRIQEALKEPVFLPGRSRPEHVAALRLVDAHTQRMIDERRRSPAARADLLTRLLLARDTEGGDGSEGMTDQQLRDEANTMFVAGHETTANALAWAFYLLARNPEARARVQAEADAFGPEGPTTWKPEMLAYTLRALKEVLRLYPTIVVVVRRSLVPVQILGQTYPERTLVFVNLYGVHRWREAWDDPERFDPDRFLPEREAERHKSAWVPFGVGPRVCLGNSFALMEGAVVLATMMRGVRYEIDPSLTVTEDAMATLRPRGGLPAVVRRES